MSFSRPSHFACVLAGFMGIVCLIPPCWGSTVTIDANGLVNIDGQAVFPIGFTMPPPPDALSPDGHHAWDELKAAGGSFVRSGPVGHGWDDAAIDLEQKFEDAAVRSGLHCLPFLQDLGALPEGNATRAAKLKAIVSRFKNHPGLGLWKGADEPEWGKIPVADVVRARALIREIDPNHPVWIVQAPRGTVDTLRAYDAAYDVTGTDIYPISYPPGVHSLLANKEISMVGDYAQRMQQVAGNKPFWMTLQIAWSGVTKPGKTLRFPTFAQERFMAYQAIVNGARGLVFFGGHLPQTWNDRDSKLRWNWTFWETVLRPVVAEIGANSALAPVLVAPDSKVGMKVEGNEAEGIEFTVRRTASSLILIAVKREGQTTNVRFTGLPAVGSTGQVLYEEPRKVVVENGSFEDWFAPFDVHVYVFRL